MIKTVFAVNFFLGISYTKQIMKALINASNIICEICYFNGDTLIKIKALI